jgi:hypothetical protein
MSRRARKRGYPRREQRLPRDVAEALQLVHVDVADLSIWPPRRPTPMSAAEVMAFMVAPDLADLPDRDPYVAAKRQRKLHQSSVEALRHEAEKRLQAANTLRINALMAKRYPSMHVVVRLKADMPVPASMLTNAQERRLARRRAAREAAKALEELSRQSA